MKQLIITWIILSSISISVVIAQISPDQEKQIDSLFMEWNTPNHPGGSIGIMKGKELVYSKAFGLASLEYLVPNTTETIYNTASVSKQFTALGIVRLHLQNKLSVDDDIRKYLPDLPDFGHLITIRHLLHHTSGLRSLHALFALAGWREDDSRTNADLNRIMLRQKDLNFTPGEEYLYCNTGYMFMSTIIEKVTGENFPEWMKENIFKPLGMNHAYVEDKYDRVVRQNATSYYSSSTRAVEYWGYVGSGNMHATTNDLLKYLSNYYQPKAGWEEAFQMMLTQDTFNNGVMNNYAFGVNIQDHLEKKRIQHGGSIGGFRSSVCTYPEEELSIAVLTNFSQGNPGGKANDIAGILIENTEKEAETPAFQSISLSNKILSQYEGTYWNEREKFSRKINLDRDTLRYARSAENESPLVPIDKNRFKMINVDADLEVIFEGTGIEKTMTVIVDNAVSSFSEIDPLPVNQNEISEYAGSYYSPEIETVYRMFVEDNQLNASHIRHGRISMKFMFKDVADAGWPLDIVEFKRDGNGTVNGIMVSNGRVRNLWFEKR